MKKVMLINYSNCCKPTPLFRYYKLHYNFGRPYSNIVGYFKYPTQPHASAISLVFENGML